MENAQVSIIIPVYNVQDYLPQCVESVLAQTYTQLQIVLVDDGSTDNSGALCRHYANLDSRVALITQENQGVSAARNAGIASATGEYLTFVDGDDTIEPDYIQQLLSGMQPGVDLV